MKYMQSVTVVYEVDCADVNWAADAVREALRDTLQIYRGEKGRHIEGRIVSVTEKKREEVGG